MSFDSHLSKSILDAVHQDVRYLKSFALFKPSLLSMLYICKVVTFEIGKGVRFASPVARREQVDLVDIFLFEMI